MFHHILLLSQVDKIFKDPSIGNPMSVALVKMVVLRTDKEWATYSASVMLKKFCDWQHSMNTPDDMDPNHHDAAIFLTRWVKQLQFIGM